MGGNCCHDRGDVYRVQRDGADERHSNPVGHQHQVIAGAGIGAIVLRPRTVAVDERRRNGVGRLRGQFHTANIRLYGK